MLFKKTIVSTNLIDTYNYIFLTHFSLAGTELDPKDDIFQTRLNLTTPTSFWFQKFSSNSGMSEIGH